MQRTTLLTKLNYADTLLTKLNYAEDLLQLAAEHWSPTASRWMASVSRVGRALA